MTNRITNSLTTEQLIINRLVHDSSLIDNTGLLNGKMGIAIFFFHLARKSGDKTYENYAGELIDGIYQKISSNIMPLDFENGLAGVGWGIEHLVQNNYLEADTDEVLSDLDDKIFLSLANNGSNTIYLKNGLLGYGVYLLTRLGNKDLEKVSGRGFLLKRLMIDLINRLYKIIEEKEEILLEPVTFDVMWPLPLTLLFLSEIKRLNIYNHKVDIILNRLSPTILSTFPVKHSNRLFLRIGMEAVSEKTPIFGWNKHICLLKDNTTTDHISQEFSNMNIMVSIGITGIGLIVKLFSRYTDEREMTQFLSKITDKLLQSNYWEFVEREKKLHAEDLGLLNGLAGMGCLLFDALIPKPS